MFVAKQKMSIYLIKEGFAIGDVVDSDDPYIHRHILKDGSVVFIKPSNPQPPKWIDYFDGQLEFDTLLSSSASALHLVSVVVENGDERLFAVSFGYGYALLNKETVEERFGLKVALNQAADGGLRKLKRTAISGNSRKTDEQMPRPSSVDAFEIDVEQDLLEGVTVSGGDGLLATGSITGSDSLALSVDESVGSICDFLKSAYGVYTLDSYKSRYAWVDRILPVRSKTLQEALNSKAIDLIGAQDKNVWLAVPEVLEWEAIAGFQVRYNDSLLDDVCLDMIYPDVRQLPKSYEDLCNTRISVIGQATGSVIKKWRASECLYGEVEYQGNSYCANNGKWYLIDADYKSLIESRFTSIPLYKRQLPDYFKGENEGPYNQRVVELNSSSELLLDKRTVHYGGRGSQIELCDILCKDGTFIHVKHYQGSSTLSHLFNQGLVSTRLIKSDASFRKCAQGVIDKIEPNSFDLGKDSVKRVVFAIISRFDDARPVLPFFSKVALDAVCTQLAAMDVDVALARIKEIRTDCS